MKVRFTRSGIIRPKLGTILLISMMVSSVYLFGYEGTLLGQDIFETDEKSEEMQNNFANLSTQSDQDVLFEGTNDPVIINETAVLRQTDSYNLGNNSEPGYTEQTAEYYIDSTHGWKVNAANFSIYDIQDERDWVSNGDFESGSNGWTYSEVENNIGGRQATASGGTGSIGGHSAIYTKIAGDEYTYFLKDYYKYNPGDYAIYSRSITVPRGEVIDAWFSMDYYLESGVSTNDLFIAACIEGETIWSKGFRTINNIGTDQWLSSGTINMQIWENASDVFDETLFEQSIDISFGLYCETNETYNEDTADGSEQSVYFDNIELILKTQANSTQSNIEIEFEGSALSDSQDEWAQSSYQCNGVWVDDPFEIDMTTNASKLSYELDATINAYHETSSKLEQYGDEGTKIAINQDGTVDWEFYHNVFRPSDYEDYEFTVFKPDDWNITEIRDPLGLTVNYSEELNSAESFTINSTYPYYPGWWRFEATSSNRLLLNETDFWNSTDWNSYEENEPSTFTYNVDDILSITSKIDTSKSEIQDIESTWANLTIYNSSGDVWTEETVHPDIDGNILFPNLTIGGLNTSGGTYSWKIIWMNGLCGGGLNGTFDVVHDAIFDILYPVIGNNYNVTLLNGSTLTFRFMLNDTHNTEIVSGAQISCLINNGTVVKTFTETEPGVYELNILPNEIGEPGTYYFPITITTDGYNDEEVTIRLDYVTPYIPDPPTLRESIEDKLWLIILIGAFLISVMAYIIYRQNVIIPKRNRAKEALIQQVQIFDDVNNIRGIMIIHKESGLLLYNHNIRALDGDETLITGFLQAIMLFSKNLTGDEKEAESLEFAHDDFNILIQDGKYARIAMILENRASPELIAATSVFSDQIDINFKDAIQNWQGNTDVFADDAPVIIEHIFQVSLGQDFTVPQNYMSFWAGGTPKDSDEDDEMTSRVMRIIGSLSVDSSRFRLETVYMMFPTVQQPRVKEVLLKLIQERRIVSYAEVKDKLQDFSDEEDDSNLSIEEIKAKMKREALFGNEEDFEF